MQIMLYMGMLGAGLASSLAMLLLDSTGQLNQTSPPGVVRPHQQIPIIQSARIVV
jgi:hypothetical protein